MNTTDERTARAIGFEITGTLGMGLSTGEAFASAPREPSWWLTFSICPEKYPSSQEIYLARKEKVQIYDSAKPYREPRRRLTSEIKGSLQIRVLGLPDLQTGGASVAFGELSHGPESKREDFYYAVSYCIQINLPEAEFSEIRNAFLNGKAPTSITVWTPDIEFGFLPDGRDKVWEVWDDHVTYAQITGFSLALSTDIPRVGIGPKKS